VARRLASVLVGMTVLMLASAQAQTSEWDGNGFISISGGSQFSDKQFEERLSVPKFDETAEFQTDHTSGSGGILDVAGGLRLVGNLAFGVGFSLMENQGDATGHGTVPNPLFFDRDRSVTFDATGLKHREVGIHFSAVYVIPLGDRFLVSIFGGPTVFRLRQELVGDVALGPELDLPFFDSVDVASVTTTSVSETGLGGHVGVDGTFLLNDQLGVVGFFRFDGGSVDVATGTTQVSIDVGGAQAGGGLRIFLPLPF